MSEIRWQACYTSGTMTTNDMNHSGSVGTGSLVALSSLETTVSADRIKGVLLNAKRYGRLRRLRVSATSVAVGGALCSFGAIGSWAIASPIWVIAPYLCLLTGMPVVLLAILPGDKRAIKIVGISFVVLIWFLSLYQLDWIRTGFQRLESGECKDETHVQPCESIIPGTVVLAIWILINMHQSACLVRHILYARHALLLDTIWVLFSRLVCFGGVMMIAIPAVILIVSQDARNESGYYLYACRNAGLSLWSIAISYVIGRRNFRSSVQTWLSSRKEAASASGIASLLSGQVEEDLWERAKSTFRYVSADQLTEVDMRVNTPNPELRKLTKSARLCQVDAFVSHSWHDDSTAKWQALQEWRREFREHHGREPRLWIDKYCIDQGDIQGSLACLPVYVAGCKQLLVLCGYTYLQRLWCLMELFVFLEMGRSVENISVCPIRLSTQNSLDKLLDDIRSFSASKAICFLQEDTDKLLGIIESGTGGFHDLEVVVKRSLIQAIGLKRDSIRSFEKSMSARQSRSLVIGDISLSLPSQESDIATDKIICGSAAGGDTTLDSSFMLRDTPMSQDQNNEASLCPQRQPSEGDDLCSIISV